VKLQKVQSLRSVKNATVNPEFKDPALNKPVFHHGGVVEEAKGSDGPVSAMAIDQTEEEKIAAELARMNRTLKKGGHGSV
jgi:hypothetical protein